MRSNDLEALITAANNGDDAAKHQLETTFNVGQILAVYGSLAPGKINYHIVEPLGGKWSDGFVEGDLFQTGWGASLGYWAFRPRAGGDVIPVKVLTSSRLPDAWPMLDGFEGNEYSRIVVPILTADNKVWTVANIYAAADGTRQAHGHYN